MAELRIPEPSEKQCLFMADRHKYIGYGGARGGGKSWAVRVKAVLLCLRYAGIKVMIIRKTYPELQENHIIPLCEMLGCYADESERIASYNDGKKHIVFPNGSRILFRYCDNDRMRCAFKGRRWTCCSWTRRRSRARRRWRSCAPACEGERFSEACLHTCNPEERGHAWVKRLFIDRRFRGGRVAGGAQLHTVADNGQHGTDGGRPAIHKAARRCRRSSVTRGSTGTGRYSRDSSSRTSEQSRT